MLHISDFLERKPFDLQTFCHPLQEHWSAGASFYSNRRLTSFWRLWVSACYCCCFCGLRAKVQIRASFNTHREFLNALFGSIWLTLPLRSWHHSIFILFIYIFVLLLISQSYHLSSGQTGRKSCMSYPKNDIWEQHVTLPHHPNTFLKPSLPYPNT